MSIYDQIIATGPWLYWPLQETTGTVAADASGHAINGVYSGDLQLGITGPEFNTFGTRIYSSGKIQSPGLGLTAYNSFTVGAWITARSDGSLSGYNLWGGICDINNPTLHGIQLQLTNPSATSMTVRLQSGTVMTSAVSFAQPVSYWHFVTWTHTAVPLLTIPFADGTQSTSTSTNLVGSWQTTDTLWVQASFPIAVAHMVVWDRALAQSEVAVIAAQVQAWPYIIPSNQIPATGTVDLTPVTTDTSAIIANQSTYMPQITNIQSTTTEVANDTDNILGFWNGYQSVTLPSLNETLGNILNGLTSTLTGAAGAVQKTLGDLFSHQTVDLITQVGSWDACAPSVIHAELGGGTIFGIEMECTTYPDWITFTGWGQNYTIQSLGTLEIQRGGNTVLRVGLHSTTHMVYPLPGVSQNVFDQLLPLVPPEYEVILTPAPDCCWHLVGLGFP